MECPIPDAGKRRPRVIFLQWVCFFAQEGHILIAVVRLKTYFRKFEKISIGTSIDLYTSMGTSKSPLLNDSNENK